MTSPHSKPSVAAFFTNQKERIKKKKILYTVILLAAVILAYTFGFNAAIESARYEGSNDDSYTISYELIGQESVHEYTKD